MNVFRLIISFEPSESTFMRLSLRRTLVLLNRKGTKIAKALTLFTTIAETVRKLMQLIKTDEHEKDHSATEM